LILRLLGPPCFEREGRSFVIERRKGVALLAYVALADVPIGRDVLAGLFWPEQDAERGLAALRVTLSELRGLLGPELLEVDRKTIHMPTRPAVSLDVHDFEQAFAITQAGSPLRESMAQRVAQAAALYRGDFLQGFSLRDSVAFDEWQALRAEHLRGRAKAMLTWLVDAHDKLQQPDLALAAARRLTTIDPLDERAHRRLMELYAQQGRRAEALRQYELCVSRMRAEFGVQPERETRRLRGLIAAGPAALEGQDEERSSRPPAAMAPPSPRPATGNLPAPVSPLVGRATELSLIQQRLDDPACRLLTITGLGGVGKTVLALEAARRRAARFQDGAWLVPLAAVSEAELLPSVITDAVGVPPGADPPRTRLLGYLRDRQMLLVLDNVEHLLEGASLLGEIAANAAGVQMLVTSRERVNARGEWELALEGLPLPDETSAVASSAVDLFVQTAQRVLPAFAPGTEDMAAVARICRLVGGMPLGIELAAAALRSASPAEIAAALERDLDALVGPRDAPERHRSMRASFVYSLGLLSAEERCALGRLSVFRGDAAPDAAASVTMATQWVLGALIEKSLVCRTPSGRYGLHELLRQFAGEMLAERPHELHDAQARHAAVYTSRLAEWHVLLVRPRRAALLAEIEVDLENARAALRWAAEQGQFHLVDRALDGLCAIEEALGHAHEAELLLGYVAEALRRAGGMTVFRLLGRVLVQEGRFAMEVGATVRAAGFVDEGVRLLQASGAEAELSMALLVAGRLGLAQGNFGAARWSLRASLSLAKNRDDRRGMAWALRELSRVFFDQGDTAKAERLLRRSLLSFRALGDVRGAADCLGGLGAILHFTGSLDEAAAAYREGLGGVGEAELERAQMLLGLGRVERERGALAEARRQFEACLRLGRATRRMEVVASALVGLGRVKLEEGDSEGAGRHLEEGLRMHEGMLARRGLAEAWQGLGRVATAHGDRERARACYESALGAALEAGAGPLVLEVLVDLCEVAFPEGKAESLSRSLGMLAGHSSAEHGTRARAERLRVALSGSKGKVGSCAGVKKLPAVGLLVEQVLRALTRPGG
jgi:predicted ATPase/DNA-binding SARP family transcriptional activator